MRRITKAYGGVGRMCQTRRMQSSVNQKEVAETTGYSVQTISAFERGKMRSMDLLIWYMLNLGVTLEDIVRCIKSE